MAKQATHRRRATRRAGPREPTEIRRPRAPKSCPSPAAQAAHRRMHGVAAAQPIRIFNRLARRGHTKRLGSASFLGQGVSAKHVHGFHVAVVFLHRELRTEARHGFPFFANTGVMSTSTFGSMGVPTSYCTSVCP